MNEAGNGLGSCMLVVWDLFVGFFVGGLQTCGLVIPYPPSPHSLVQLLPGEEEPRCSWTWGGLNDEA